MKRLASLSLLACFALAGCDPETQTNKGQQAQRAAEAAQSIHFTENAEIDNIKRRLEQTADPGKFGFILLLNQAGQPIMYEGVKGKITSGGKRLTPITEVRCVPAYKEKGERSGCNYNAVPGPSDEGTYGNSNPYIFYWNTDGVYRQWDGGYLYSDQPIRLRVEPLIVSIQADAK